MKESVSSSMRFSHSAAADHLTTMATATSTPWTLVFGPQTAERSMVAHRGFRYYAGRSFAGRVNHERFAT